MGRPNLSRETKFSGADGDEEIIPPDSADDEQDWQPYPVDTFSAIRLYDDHTHIHQTVFSVACNSDSEILAALQ